MNITQIKTQFSCTLPSNKAQQVPAYSYYWTTITAAHLLHQYISY